jgi:23S rRNA pseudouridine1911/1915/1917 synthase
LYYFCHTIDMQHKNMHIKTEPYVLYEDNHLLVVYKPAGWLTQGDDTGDMTILDWGKAYIKAKYDKPGEVFLHAVHRLDRPVSGVLIMARTGKSLGRMAEMFRQKSIQKEYWALTLKAPANASSALRHFLLKDEERNVVNIVPQSTPNAKEALLRYEYDGQVSNYHRIKVFPQTGRPHQIRVQLAFIGCPIVGDLRYGAAMPRPDASIALHCRRMTLIHPVKREPMEVIAELPADFYTM